MKEHCVNVKTFNCKDTVRNVTRTVQVIFSSLIALGMEKLKLEIPKSCTGKISPCLISRFQYKRKSQSQGWNVDKSTYLEDLHLLKEKQLQEQNTEGYVKFTN